MRAQVGLNLGCGEHAHLGGDAWLNVDRHDLPHWQQPPDVIANVLTGLPFPPGRFASVYLGHILEHLGFDEEIPVLWTELRRVCRPGAVIRVVGPCVDKAQALGLDPGWIATWSQPSDDPSGCVHRWTPTTDATVAAVRQFDPQASEIPVWSVQPPDWPNAAPNAAWQVAVAATVP